MILFIILIVIWLVCGGVSAYILTQLLGESHDVLDALCFLFGPAALGATIVIVINHYNEKRKK